MNKELAQQLRDKYPKILGTLDICTGDGWYVLLDTLCHWMQFHTDNNNVPQFVAVQVKEKFGGLRFYGSGGNQETSGAIAFAELYSFTMCQDCGAPGTKGGESYIRVLCDKHIPKNEQKFFKKKDK